MIPQPFSEIAVHADQAALQGGLIALLGLAAAALLGWALSGYLTRPISAVSRATSNMACGNHETRVAQLSGFQPREIKNLEHSFNVMAAAIQIQSRELTSAVTIAEKNLKIKDKFFTMMSHELPTRLMLLSVFPT
jgi:signal transduction histidine kinase